MQKQVLNAGADYPIILVIDREVIERKAYGKVLAPLKLLAADRESIRKYANSVYLVFNGYDNDKRELFEIAEVRDFVQALHGEFPHWFHFLNKVDPTLLLVCCCIVPSKVIAREDGQVGIEMKQGGMARLILELYSEMNHLYSENGLTKKENELMTSIVNEYLDSL
jgi:hypothetical protein